MLSHYAASKLMDHLFDKASYSPPSLYIALLTAAAVATDTGSTITEPSGGSYARLATSGSDWGSPSGGEITNTSDLYFPDSTGSWGDIVGLAICDASSGGNVLFSTSLTSTRTIGTDVTPKFPAGDIVLAFQSAATISNYLRNALLGHVMGKGAYTTPGIYAGLVTVTPTRTSTGSTISEPDGNFARVATTSSTWTSASDGVTTSAADIEMVKATSTWSSGGNMTAIVLVDDPTVGDGNLLAWCVPTTPKNVIIADKPLIDSGILSFTLS